LSPLTSETAEIIASQKSTVLFYFTSFH